MLSSPQEDRSFSVAAEPANPPVVESLLRSLPGWFGIEEAIVEYTATAARLPTWMARDDEGTPAGVLLVGRHFPAAAEVFLMAVDPATTGPESVGRWSPPPRTIWSPTGSGCCR